MPTECSGANRSHKKVKDPYFITPKIKPVFPVSNVHLLPKFEKSTDHFKYRVAELTKSQQS